MLELKEKEQTTKTTTQEELDRKASEAKRASDDWEKELDRIDDLGEEEKTTEKGEIF